MPAPTPPAAAGAARARAPAAAAYWRQTRRLTAWLLALWFAVTFVATFFARELRMTFLGWPLSFYLAAQGALLVYLGIVLAYAVLQRRRDRAFGVAESEDA